MPAFFSDTFVGHSDFAKCEGEMKRQHNQSDDQSPRTAGDALPDSTGRQTFTYTGLATGTDGCAPASPVATLNAPMGEAWWDEEEPMTRTGGVCLLIA